MRLLKKLANRRKLAFCRKAIAQADMVLSHNPIVAERFADLWNPRCHVLVRPFVTDEIRLSDEQFAKQKDFLRDTTRPLKVVFAGRLIRIKAVDQIIEAIAKVKQRGVRVEFDIIGEGEDAPALKQLAADRGVREQVRFIGALPYGKPLFDAWATAHVMAVTNLTPEISRNVLLSCARGIPLVIYSNPGTDPMLRENDAAIIVPPGDIDRLADAIMTLARDRERLVQLAENGLKLAGLTTIDSTHRHRAQLVAKMFNDPASSR